MTQQQYERAVQINKRIGELEDTLKNIEVTSRHRLWYARKGDDWRLTPSWAMEHISDILDKHDLMIRQEIDDEINKLKQEIETL